MNLEQLNQHPLLTLHCDGRVTVTDKLKPEETAKLVLEKIKTQWMDDAQATKIRELNDRIKRLEEAGDKLYWAWMHPFDTAEETLGDNWRKAKEAKP